MGKYFGTDGFRGEANVNLTADHAFKVGRFLGWYYTQIKRRNGQDGPARIGPCYYVWIERSLFLWVNILELTASAGKPM